MDASVAVGGAGDSGVQRVAAVPVRPAATSVPAVGAASPLPRLERILQADLNTIESFGLTITGNFSQASSALRVHVLAEALERIKRQALANGFSKENIDSIFLGREIDINRISTRLTVDADSVYAGLIRYLKEVYNIDIADTFQLSSQSSTPAAASRPAVIEIPSQYMVGADSYVDQIKGSLTLRSPVLDQPPASAEWVMKNLQWLSDEGRVWRIELAEGETAVAGPLYRSESMRIELPTLVRAGLVSPKNGTETTAKAKVLKILVKLAKSGKGEDSFGPDFLYGKVISLDAILRQLPSGIEAKNITEAMVIDAFYACHESQLKGSPMYVSRHTAPYVPQTVYNGRPNPLAYNEDVQATDLASVRERLLDESDAGAPDQRISGGPPIVYEMQNFEGVMEYTHELSTKETKSLRTLAHQLRVAYHNNPHLSEIRIVVDYDNNVSEDPVFTPNGDGTYALVLRVKRDQLDGSLLEKKGDSLVVKAALLEKIQTAFTKIFDLKGWVEYDGEHLQVFYAAGGGQAERVDFANPPEDLNVSYQECSVAADGSLTPLNGSPEQAYSPRLTLNRNSAYLFTITYNKGVQAQTAVLTRTAIISYNENSNDRAVMDFRVYQTPQGGWKMTLALKNSGETDFEIDPWTVDIVSPKPEDIQKMLDEFAKGYSTAVREKAEVKLWQDGGV